MGRAAPAASKSRSVVNLKYPIEHGIVTNWDDTERSLASSAGPRRQASWLAWTKRSADTRFIDKEASGIHNTSRICTPSGKTMFQVFVFVASSGHDGC